jgi:hypothetical protein
MSTDMSWTGHWTCTTVIEGKIMPTYYNVNINFQMLAEDVWEQTVTFGRMRALIKEIYKDSIFISMDDPLLPVLKKKTQQQITTFPKNPTDMLISLITWHKLTAITEGRAIIDTCTVSSDVSDNLIVHLDADYVYSTDAVEDNQLKPFGDKPAWWYRPEPCTGDFMEFQKNQTKLHIETGRWLDYLLWQPKKKNTIKNTQDNVVPIKTNWKPEVIIGDKT